MSLRASVRRFAHIQNVVLNKSKNRSKGGWKDCSFDYLIKRLKEEVKELESSIKKITKDTAPDIDSECADVANFAMMISDNFNRLHRGIGN